MTAAVVSSFFDYEVTNKVNHIFGEVSLFLAFNMSTKQINIS